MPDACLHMLTLYHTFIYRFPPSIPSCFHPSICWSIPHSHPYLPGQSVGLSFRVAGARDCAPLQKRAKREGFVACPKTMAGMDRHGTFEEDLQRCIFRGRRSTKDMFMRDVRKISLRYIPAKWMAGQPLRSLMSGPASHCDLFW